MKKILNMCVYNEYNYYRNTNVFFYFFEQYLYNFEDDEFLMFFPNTYSVKPILKTLLMKNGRCIKQSH